MFTRTRIIIGLAAIVALILAVLFVTGTLSSMFSSGKEARVAKGQAGASIDAGAEATNTIGNVMAREAETDATVKEGSNEIRSQPAGRSNDAAIRAACRLRINFNQQRCAELRAADSANAARPGPAR